MLGWLMVGCQTPGRSTKLSTQAELGVAVRTGQLGRSRVALQQNLTQDRADRNYLLDRLSLGVVTLADGYPQAAEGVFSQVYDLLRTQGINEDKTVESVVLNEDLRFWKGEPFEQAMAFAYTGLTYAMLGDWGNLRAASDNALFYLRDFGTDDQGQPYDQTSLIRESADADSPDPLETYQPRPSNFTLGYLLNGIANQQLAREAEADERFAAAVESNPAVAGLVDALKRGSYNLLLVVDYGRGPKKIGTGPDNAIARFVPVTPSDNAMLEATVAGRVARWPIVIDLNTIATDLMWNNLQDMRKAKSFVGSVLLTGGAVATGVGAAGDSKEATLAGLGAMAAGAWAKAGAHADTRHSPVLPQRVYLVPVSLPVDVSTVELQIAGRPGSRLVLRGLDAPRQGVMVRYIRLPAVRRFSPEWAGSGELHYANAYEHPPPLDELPYILGGRCVRPPTPAVLSDYHAAGNLTSMSMGALTELYRAEAIERTVPPGRLPGLHVLEGGDSLVCPWPGTTGYARLFGQRHAPYRPRSQPVTEAADVVSSNQQSYHDRQHPPHSEATSNEP
jgi:hypothetical protein